MKLDVSQKIKRGNDGLYDMLGTEQLRIAQHARMRQDIFLDSERIAKLLGSEFAKFHFVNNALKFCWLARGDEEQSEAKSRERVGGVGGVLVGIGSLIAGCGVDNHPRAL